MYIKDPTNEASKRSLHEMLVHLLAWSSSLVLSIDTTAFLAELEAMERLALISKQLLGQGVIHSNHPDLKVRFASTGDQVLMKKAADDSLALISLSRNVIFRIGTRHLRDFQFIFNSHVLDDIRCIDPKISKAEFASNLDCIINRQRQSVPSIARTKYIQPRG